MSHLYISYDQIDGLEPARLLSQYLETGWPGFPTWLVDKNRAEGEDPGSQALEAIRVCKAMLVILTAKSGEPTSRCRLELKRALSYQKPILSVRCASDIPIPPTLEHRNSFLLAPDISCPPIKELLTRLDSNEEKLRTLEEYRKDAETALAYCSPQEQLKEKNRFESLQEQIRSLKGLMSNRDEIIKSNDLRIQNAIEREKRPESRSTYVPIHRTVNKPPVEVPAFFQNRHLETELLIQFLQENSSRIIITSGRSGVGKTAMTCRLLNALERGVLPHGKSAFDIAGIIYMNEAGSRAINFHNLFYDLTLLLDNEPRQRLLAILDNDQLTIEAKLAELIVSLPDRPVIVLLDNFEDKTDPQSQLIKDQDLKDALLHFASTPRHSVKFVITTRYDPVDLRAREPGAIRHIPLDEGLESPYAENLLKELDASGAFGLKDAPDDLLKRIRDFTRGFPKALNSFFAILSVDPTVTPEDILDSFQSSESITRVLIGEAFSRLPEIDQKIMQALAIYGFPVASTGVDFLLSSLIPDINSISSLRKLVNMRFVVMDGRNFYLHTLDKEYALARLRSEETSGSTFTFSIKTLKKTAAKYMHEIALPGDEWKTLNDVVPQLQEFDLLLEAGDDFSAGYVLEALDSFLEKKGGLSFLLEMAEKLEKQATDGQIKKIALTALSLSCWRRGQTDKAIEHQKKLIELAKGSPEDEFWAKANLLVYERYLVPLEDTLTGLQHLLAELEFRYPHDTLSLINAHSELSNCYRGLGFYRESIEHAEKALTLAHSLGNIDPIEAQTHNYANAIITIDRMKAIGYFKKAFDLAVESGISLYKAYHLSELAACSFQEGSIDKAIVLAREAIGIRKAISDLGGEAENLCELSNFLLHQGKYAEAGQDAETALAIAKSIRAPLGHPYQSLAEAQLYQEKFEEALGNIKEALNTAREHSYHPKNIAGIISFHLNKPILAKSYFASALEESNKYIERFADNSSAWEAKALALSGFTRLGIDPASNRKQAISAYQRSYELDSGKGVLMVRKRLLSFLNTNGVLDAIHQAVDGSTAAPVPKIGSNPLKAFISYSKHDGELSESTNYLEAFKASLSPLIKHTQKLIAWDDTELIAGEDWDNSIKAQINKADVIFLLLSNDFLNTDYIQHTELELAHQREKKNQCIVLPILIRDTAFEDIPWINKKNVIPRKGCSIASFQERFPTIDSAWKHVYMEIRKAVNDFIARRDR